MKGNLNLILSAWEFQNEGGNHWNEYEFVLNNGDSYVEMIYRTFNSASCQCGIASYHKTSEVEFKLFLRYYSATRKYHKKPV